MTWWVPHRFWKSLLPSAFGTPLLPDLFLSHWPSAECPCQLPSQSLNVGGSLELVFLSRSFSLVNLVPSNLGHPQTLKPRLMDPLAASPMSPWGLQRASQTRTPKLHAEAPALRMGPAPEMLALADTPQTPTGSCLGDCKDPVFPCGTAGRAIQAEGLPA